MSESAQRPVAAIESDLRTCRAVKLGAQGELCEVRRRQRELAEIEAALVLTMEARRHQADRLLDELLDAGTDDEGRARVPAPDDGWRLAAV